MNKNLPNISKISRGSIHDGDGIRTVVYFNGCNLDCKWCHNPECQEISQKGLQYSVKQLCLVLLKDKDFYISSGGGVTFSGGECLLHSDFLSKVLRECKKAGLNTAIETAFSVPYKGILKTALYIDQFIIDIKHMDSEKHLQYTNQPNSLILDNIKKISGIHDNICIRVSLIPGFNDDEQNLAATAAFLNGCGSGIKKVELQKYNDLAQNKYAALNKEFVSFGVPQSAAQMNAARGILVKNCRKNIRIE